MTDKVLIQKHWEWLDEVAGRIEGFRHAERYLLDTDSTITTFWLVTYPSVRLVTTGQTYDFAQITDRTKAVLMLPNYPSTLNDLIRGLATYTTGADWGSGLTATPQDRAAQGVRGGRRLTEEERSERVRCLAQLESRIRALGKLLGLREGRQLNDE